MNRTTYFVILRSQALKIWKETEELIFGGNGIVSMSKKPFSLSGTNCRTSAASWWELKLNGEWWGSEILQVRAHKKFDECTGLLVLDFIFMFIVIDFGNKDKDGNSYSTLFQSNGKMLGACRMAFT